jgi:hypothetical protein
MKIQKEENLPIYKKAEHIFQLVESLVSILPEDDEYFNETKHFMTGDAMFICAKIMGAEGGDLYCIRMQNAALIRKAAMDLYVHVGGLRMFDNFKDKNYIPLIRQEIEEFRLLFIEWVASFDTSNYIWDEWELFNPKGAIPPNPNDYQDPINFDDFDFDDFESDEEE